MSQHEATTVIRKTPPTPQVNQYETSLQAAVAESIALVTLTTLKRNNPELKGFHLWHALVDFLRDGVINPEDETAAFAKLYPLVFPGFNSVIRG